MHCHQIKKTGFIVLKGRVEVQLGFYKKIILNGPAKLMIRPGLFHSTKSISKGGANILEIESPVDKDDLVRFKDNYGREDTPYEGRNKMKKTDDNTVKFKIPKSLGINKYSFNSLKITVEKQKDINKLINKQNRTIFAVLDGGLVDKNNRLVLSPGDIVGIDTIKKLSEVFKIKNKISFLTVLK